MTACRSTNGWIDEFRCIGALWFHDKNPERPHILLTSEDHSDSFFNAEKVMENPDCVHGVCHDLVRLLQLQDLRPTSVDRVVGPAMGAITLAHDIAKTINRETGEAQCLRAYTEKEVRNNRKFMVFKQAQIKPGERVLLVEDVLTTGESIDLTANAVIGAGGIVLPFVACIINRSGNIEVRGKRIVALANFMVPRWPPKHCPLYKQGSEAIRPEGLENWARLNAQY